MCTPVSCWAVFLFIALKPCGRECGCVRVFVLLPIDDIDVMDFPGVLLPAGRL